MSGNGVFVTIGIGRRPTALPPVNGRAPLTDAEQAQRREAIAFGCWSVRLEGFVVSEAVESLFQQYIGGNLTEDECPQAVLRATGFVPRP